MLNQISLLIKLQAVDKTAFDLEKELKEIPGRLQELSDSEAKAREELNQLSQELESVRGLRKDLEHQNDTVKSRLRKAETKLMGSKNQKEHRAATAELEDGRDIIRANDDQLLQLMEKEQPLEQKVSLLKEDVEQQTKKLEEAREQLEARKTEAEKILAEINNGRDEVEKQIPAAVLREYNFIRSRRQGIALSPISKANCGICHMQISPQQFNELQRSDKLMHCPSCKRIIYWADAEGLNE